MIRRIAYAALAIGILFTQTPSSAHADYDEPPEYYVKPGFTPIDTDALVKQCDDSTLALRSSPVTAHMLQGAEDYIRCLQSTVLKVWDDHFDPAYRRERTLDQKLDQLISFFLQINYANRSGHLGCVEIGACSGLEIRLPLTNLTTDMLVDMLRRIQAAQQEDPPKIRNPIREEWFRAGMPMDWPQDRMVPAE